MSATWSDNALPSGPVLLQYGKRWVGVPCSDFENGAWWGDSIRLVGLEVKGENPCDVSVSVRGRPSTRMRKARKNCRLASGGIS